VLASRPAVVALRKLPVRFQVDLKPEQEARQPALVETREMEIAAEMEVTAVADEASAIIIPHKTAQSGTPRGAFSSRRSVQIHVHEDAKTGRMTVLTDAGDSLDCGRTRFLEIHHIATRKQGRTNDPENLVMRGIQHHNTQDYEDLGCRRLNYY